MNTETKFDRRRPWLKKIGLFILLAPLFVLAFGFVVMTLWNFTLPAIFGISTITFWQAIALTILSKILFGGFHGKGQKQHYSRGDHWTSRWKNMSEEERAQYKSRWKNWCEPQPQETHKSTEELS